MPPTGLGLKNEQDFESTYHDIYKPYCRETLRDFFLSRTFPCYDICVVTPILEMLAYVMAREFFTVRVLSPPVRAPFATLGPGAVAVACGVEVGLDIFAVPCHTLLEASARPRMSNSSKAFNRSLPVV